MKNPKRPIIEIARRTHVMDTITQSEESEQKKKQKARAHCPPPQFLELTGTTSASVI
jgi:hypothetical protein